MRYDAAIVGGGVAGAALAAILARAGRTVVLFEKEKGAHDKVCGEFISEEGARYLHGLGLSIERLGAVAIGQVRLARRGEAITTTLPFEARSLSRRVLDQALLALAETAGAEIRRGARVKGLQQKGTWAVQVDGQETVQAAEVFLATGKHDLPGWRRPSGPQADLIAFKLYWRLVEEQAAELARNVELILFPGGYAGLQAVEGDRANLCLLVRRSDFASQYKSWDGLLDGMKKCCPHLKSRLEGATALLERPLAMSRLPYGYVAREANGLWRLGDQAAVIPSFSGDGMSIALHSAWRAADFYLSGEGPSAFQHALAKDVARQIRLTTLVSRSLVSPGGQAAASALASLMPFALRSVAVLTRIPGRSLQRMSATDTFSALYPQPNQ